MTPERAPEAQRRLVHALLPLQRQPVRPAVPLAKLDAVVVSEQRLEVVVAEALEVAERADAEHRRDERRQQDVDPGSARRLELGEHGADAADGAHLVEVRAQRGGAVRHEHLGEPLDRELRTTQVDVTVDEARHEVGPRAIHDVGLRPLGVGDVADGRDARARDGDIGRSDPSGVHIEHPRTAQNPIGVCTSGGDLRREAALLGDSHRFHGFSSW